MRWLLSLCSHPSETSGFPAHQVQQGILVVTTGVSLRTEGHESKTGVYAHWLVLESPSSGAAALIIPGAMLPGEGLAHPCVGPMLQAPWPITPLFLFSVSGCFFASPFDSLINVRGLGVENEPQRRFCSRVRKVFGWPPYPASCPRVLPHVSFRTLGCPIIHFPNMTHFIPHHYYTLGDRG